MFRHYLQWHIVHECNLHCVHCYQEDYNAKMPYEKMLELLDKYEEYLKFHSYEGQINLTGGEPLLHPDIFKLIAEIKKRSMIFSILTNGTLIDEKMAEKIAEYKPLFVQISLDGPEKIHNGIRGEGAFEKALIGVDNLKKKGVKVLISFTAMKMNYKSFKEVALICKKHKVDKLWWDRVVTDDRNVYLSTEEFKELSEEACRLSKKYKFVNNNRSLQLLPEDKCGYECSAGKRLLIVLANGAMMPCRRLPFIIGSIYKEGRLVDLIDNNETMNKLSKPRFPEGCIKCKYFTKCNGGSRCVTYAQTGKLNAKDVNCYI